MIGIYFGLLALGAALAAPLSAVGVGIAEGMIFSTTIQSIARQPECEKRVTGLMFLCFGLVETLFIISLVVFFMLQSHLPTAAQVTALIAK